MNSFDKSYDSLAAAAKEILERNDELTEGSKLEDMILYSGPTGLFAKKVAKVITDNDPAAVFVPGMNTRDGVAMQRILLDYIHSKMGTDPEAKFGPFFDGIDLVGPGAAGKTALRGALDPKNRVKIKDLIKALKSFKEEVEESAEVTISVDLQALLTERLRPGRGKTTVDADYMTHDKYFTNVSQRQFKIKIKPTSSSTADITGEKKDIIAFLQSDDYGLDDRDIKDLFPELLESITEAKIEVPTDEKDITSQAEADA